MKRNLLQLAFLSLIAMPLSIYGMGPIQQTGLPLKDVKERINAWLDKDNNYKKGPWCKEFLRYMNRNTPDHELGFSIDDPLFKSAEGYLHLWIFFGGSTKYFENLRNMTITEVVKEFGESFPIFVDLKTTYHVYVKDYIKIPFVELSDEKLKDIFGEAIIRRLGDQIDKFVGEQSKHSEDDKRQAK